MLFAGHGGITLLSGYHEAALTSVIHRNDRLHTGYNNRVLKLI